LSLLLRPDRPPQNFRVVVYWRNRSWPTRRQWPVAHLVRIVQIIRTGAHGHLQPPVPHLRARKQSPIRPRNFGPLRVCQRVTYEVGGNILCAERLEGTVQLRLHPANQGGCLPRAPPRRDGQPPPLPLTSKSPLQESKKG